MFIFQNKLLFPDHVLSAALLEKEEYLAAHAINSNESNLVVSHRQLVKWQLH